MAGFYRTIATLKNASGGYTGDGGPVTGLVRLEQYGSSLAVEVSALNLSPLSQGYYLFAITDGEVYHTFTTPQFRQESLLSAPSGFAFAIFAVHRQAVMVASATCGGGERYLKNLQRRVQEQELPTAPKGQKEDVDPVIYRDEAIAEVNYYEQEAEVKTQKGEGSAPHKGSVDGAISPNEATLGEAQGDFFSKVKEEVDFLFAQNPRVKELEKVMKGAEFIHVSFDGKRGYVFGVLYEGKIASYLLYGVKGKSDRRPPSFTGYCTFVPVQEDGYWLLYQSAKTGERIE